MTSSSNRLTTRVNQHLFPNTTNASSRQETDSIKELFHNATAMLNVSDQFCNTTKQLDHDIDYDRHTWKEINDAFITQAQHLAIYESARLLKCTAGRYPTVWITRIGQSKWQIIIQSPYKRSPYFPTDNTQYPNALAQGIMIAHQKTLKTKGVFLIEASVKHGNNTVILIPDKITAMVAGAHTAECSDHKTLRTCLPADVNSTTPGAWCLFALQRFHGQNKVLTLAQHMGESFFDIIEQLTNAVGIQQYTKDAIAAQLIAALDSALLQYHSYHQCFPSDIKAENTLATLTNNQLQVTIIDGNPGFFTVRYTDYDDNGANRFLSVLVYDKAEREDKSAIYKACVELQAALEIAVLKFNILTLTLNRNRSTATIFPFIEIQDPIDKQITKIAAADAQYNYISSDHFHIRQKLHMSYIQQAIDKIKQWDKSFPI